MTLFEVKSMISRDLCLLLDSIRKKKNISMNDFVFDVVSLRQYKRYLYGTSEMPYKIFMDLSNKLNVDPMQILLEIEKSKVKQLNKLDTLFQLVTSQNMKSAMELAKEIENEGIIDTSNNIYFEITKLMIEFNQDQAPNHYYANKCANLIDYPNILKADSLNPIELFSLTILLNFVSTDEKNTIIKKVSQVINSNTFTFLNKNNRIMIYMYVKLAKEYGILKEFDEVIKICNKAIKFLENIDSHFNLDYFYYYLSLVYRNKEDHEKAHDYVRQLYYVLKVKNNPNKLKHFDALILKDFGFTFDELKVM